MIVFGITGGSGSGKTTVSELLAQRGVTIIDTDIISREITEKGSPCLCELAENFGAGILQSDGSLNRQALADIAFSDSESTAALNRITHKYIKEETEKRIRSAKTQLIGIDGAVIIGSCVESVCRFIVSVLADRSARLKRITDRDGITDAQAQKRLDAQPSDGFYKENSLYIIYNNGDLTDLKEQTDTLVERIEGEWL